MHEGGPGWRVEPPLVIWAAATVAALALAVGLVRSPLLVTAAIGLPALAALAVVGFTQPRWVLVLQVLLLSSYGVYVLGFPGSTDSLVLLVLIGIAFRFVLSLEQIEVPWKETLLLGAFVAILLAGLPFATDRGKVVEEIVRTSRNVLLVIILVALLSSPRWLERSQWAFATGAGFLAVVAVGQQVTQRYDQSFQGFAAIEVDRGLIRSSGPLSSNYFAQTLVATAALALYLGLAARTSRGRALGFGISAFSVAGVWYSFSRASLLVLVAVCLLIAILRRVRPVVVASVAAVVALAAFYALPNSQEIRSHFTAAFSSFTSASSAAEPQDVSIPGRTSENIAALRMFEDYPFLGVGGGNYNTRYTEYSNEIGLDPRASERSAHNLYLETLSETGIVGFAFFVGILALALRGAWRARCTIRGRDVLLAEGAFVAFLAFLLNGIFLHRSYEEYLWVMLALTLCAGRAWATPSTQAGVRLAGSPETVAEAAGNEPPHGDRER